MKKAAIFLIIASLVSCSQDNPEALKKKLTSYKNQQAAIAEKISGIEEQLNADTSLQEATFKTAVTLLKLKKENFSHYIDFSGKVEADLEAFVSPQVSGQIRKIHVSEAALVKKGDLLISLGTEVTEKSIQEVKTSLELNTVLYEKQKELWDQKIGSELQFLQAKSAKESLEARLATLEEQLELASIRAPFDGVIEDILMKEGELAMPGARLLHIVNLLNLTLKSDISETYLTDINVGEPVSVSFPVFNDMSMTLPISRIGSVIDNASRTFKVEVRLKNPRYLIKPNQLAVLQVKDYSNDSALVVPSVIIKQDTRGYYLYKAVEDGDGMKAKKVYVKPGKAYLERTMILEGINEGEAVIDKGYNLVKDGSPVNVISE
jgi:RND family efflux transporter MFP subunit